MQDKPIAVGFNVPFQEAIDFMKSRGVVLPEKYYGELQGIHRTLNYSIAGVASLDQLQAVLDSLSEAVKNGKTFKEWQKDVRVQDLGLSKARLDNIYRTNIQTAYNRGRWEQFVENKKSQPYLMYDAINDSRVRPSHLAMDGVIRPIDDPFWAQNYPPNGFRCVLPWTKITGDFEIGLKSFYSGEAVEIITKSGMRLAITANHPVLSNGGWVAAKSIKDGDHLLRHTGVGDIKFSGIVDNQQPPTRADDVFNALARDAFGFTDISSFEFHNDTHLRESKVYVAGFDSVLMNGVKPTSIESLEQWNFKFTNHLAIARKLHTLCSAITKSNIVNTVFCSNSFNITSRTIIFIRNLDNTFTSLIRRNYNSLKFIITRPRGNPCCAKLLFNKFGILFDYLPFQQFRFASSSSSNTSVTKPFFNRIAADTKFFCDSILTFTSKISIANILCTDWNFRSYEPSFSNFVRLIRSSFFNSSIAKQSIKQTSAYSIVFKKFYDRFTSQVSIDEVVSVRNFFFSGHVYDFQCKNSVIIAGGIITHNCRCRTISLSKSQAEIRSKNGAGLNKSITPEMKPDKGWDYNVGEDLTAGINQAVEQRNANERIARQLKAALNEKLAQADKVLKSEAEMGLAEKDMQQTPERIASELLLQNLIQRAEASTSDNLLLDLWSNEKKYHKHIEKRLLNDDISDAADYQNKTFNVLANAEKLTIAMSTTSSMISGKMQLETDEWIVILSADGKIVTSYPREQSKLTFEQNHSSFGDTIYEYAIIESIRESLKKLFS